MTRTSKEAREAAEKARKAVYEGKDKKPRKKYIKSDSEKPKVDLVGRWVEDHWGSQGWVFYIAGRYWGTMIDELGNNCSVYWSEEAWEERKENISKRKVVIRNKEKPTNQK